MTKCDHLDTIAGQDITNLYDIYIQFYINIMCCITTVIRKGSKITNNFRCIFLTELGLLQIICKMVPQFPSCYYMPLM